MKRLVPFLLVLAIVLCFALPVSAEDYTYTVRIFAGAQGTIGGQDVIIRTGLHYGDRVDFDIGSVALHNDSKYYVKGIRESGKDNNSISTNSIFVSGDIDYVVAYGLRGSSVAYTVNYVDADGGELYPATTFYGNVGDKPVVSYQYIEGYQPQAYNVTKTLSEDAAENVFTFTYTRLGAAAPVEQAPTTTPEEENPAPVRPVEEIPDENSPLVDSEENPTGTNPAELEDLDDEDVPLGNAVKQIAEIFSDAAALPAKIKFTICGCTLLALGGIGWLLLFYKRKKKDEENAKEGT